MPDNVSTKQKVKSIFSESRKIENAKPSLHIVNHGNININVSIASDAILQNSKDE